MQSIRVSPTQRRSDVTPASNRHRVEEGQDIVEYVLILPFLLLLTFSIVEGSWLVFRYNTVANAAREGARAGIVPIRADCTVDCDRVDRIRRAAEALTTGLDPDPSKLEILPPVITATTVQVTVNYNADLLTGVVFEMAGGPSTILLSATATMQRE